MSPQDKKKLAIGIGLLVVAFVVLYLTVLRRPGGGGLTPPASTATTETTTTTPTAPSGSAPSASATAPAGAPAGGAPGVAAVPAGGPMSRPPAVQGPPFKSRSDPFAHFPPPRGWEEPPPPRPLPLAAYVGWPALSHKVAYVPQRQEPGGDGGPPERGAGQRMAGVLWNGQVWAILERDNTSYVVKPGDSVGEARVHAIGRDEMVVADASGKQDVELRALAVAASAVQPTPTTTEYGRPGLPSWQPRYGVAPGVQGAGTGRVSLTPRRGREEEER